MGSEVGGKVASKTASSPGGWSVHVQSDCCHEQTIEQLPALMEFEPGKVGGLVGWARSCGTGPGGPKAKPNGTIGIWYVDLQVKDRTTLGFTLTGATFQFDAHGRRVGDVLAGCSDFVGEARLVSE